MENTLKLIEMVTKTFNFEVSAKSIDFEYCLMLHDRDTGTIHSIPDHELEWLEGVVTTNAKNPFPNWIEYRPNLEVLMVSIFKKEREAIRIEQLETLIRQAESKLSVEELTALLQKFKGFA